MNILKPYFIEISLFFLSVFFRLIVVFQYGLGNESHSSDSRWYISLARHFENYDWEKILAIMTNTPFYSLYPFLISVFSPLLPNSYQVLIIGQIILASFCVVLIYKILFKHFQSKIHFFTALLFTLNFDILLWDRFLLTDSLFLSLLIIYYYNIFNLHYIKFSLKNSRCLISLGGIVLSIFAIILTRPTMIPIVMGLILYTFTLIAKDTKKLVLLFMAIAVLATPLLLSKSYYLPYFLQRFETGEVISGRPHTFINGNKLLKNKNELLLETNSSVNNDLYKSFYIYRLILKKTIYFFSITVDGYSVKNNLIKLTYYSLFWFLCLYGLLLFYRNNVSKDKESFYYFSIISVLTILFFHVFTSIDYDFRYRNPIFPFLIIFVGNGLDGIFHKLFTNQHKKITVK